MDVIHKNVKIVRSFRRHFNYSLTIFQTNILVDVCGHAHLGGLGTALVTSDTPGVDIDRFFHGAAPELADNECIGLSDTRATKASDVYAFGVLAWEVGTVFVAPSRQRTEQNALPSVICWTGPVFQQGDSRGSRLDVEGALSSSTEPP